MCQWWKVFRNGFVLVIQSVNVHTMHHVVHKFVIGAIYCYATFSIHCFEYFDKIIFCPAILKKNPGWAPASSILLEAAAQPGFFFKIAGPNIIIIFWDLTIIAHGIIIR